MHASESDVQDSVLQILQLISERSHSDTDVYTEYSLADGVIADVVFMCEGTPVLAVECKRNEKYAKKAIGQSVIYQEFSEMSAVALSRHNVGNMDFDIVKSTAHRTDVILLEFDERVSFGNLEQHIPSNNDTLTSMLFDLVD